MEDSVVARDPSSDAEETREQIQAGADAALLVCDFLALLK
jgi:hypothetical protein